MNDNELDAYLGAPSLGWRNAQITDEQREQMKRAHAKIRMYWPDDDGRSDAFYAAVQVILGDRDMARAHSDMKYASARFTGATIAASLLNTEDTE